MGCGGSKKDDAAVPVDIGAKGEAAPVVNAEMAPVETETATPLQKEAPVVVEAPANTEAPAEAPASAEAPANVDAPINFDDVKLFDIFAKMDTNHDRSIDPTELAEALRKNPALRERLCAAAELEPSSDAEALGAAIIKAADADGDGQMQPHELEGLIRGWVSTDWAPLDKLSGAERDRQRQLAGAAVRAEQNKLAHGGFAGLTDAGEALRVGNEALKMQGGERAAFTESDPTLFGGGAVYATDAQAKAEREQREAGFREEEERELNLKIFGGLDAEEARKVGEEVKLGGEVVEMEHKAKPKKKMPARLASRLNKASQDDAEK